MGAPDRDRPLPAARFEASSEAHVHVDARTEWAGDGVRVDSVVSCCGMSGWGTPAVGTSTGVALPRTGAFFRRVDGVEHVVDRLTGYFRRPGEVSEVAHVRDEPHAGTVISVDLDLVHGSADALAGLGGTFRMTPRMQVIHRSLTARLRTDAPDDLETDVFELLVEAVEQRLPTVVDQPNRKSESTRRRAVRIACEEMTHTPSSSLGQVAKAAGYSKFHFSRVFRDVTGMSLSAYRAHLRLERVLAALADGWEDLGELATVVGFADHAHMTRSVVNQFGTTPSQLRSRFRELLAAG